MGICTNAKDIICCHRLTDLPIYNDILNKNNAKRRNILNNTIINQSIKDTEQKSFDKQQEYSEPKQLTEMDEENIRSKEKRRANRKETEKEKDKKRMRLKLQANKKLLIKDDESDLYDNDKSVWRRRGKTVLGRDPHKFVNDKEISALHFQRNKRKSATLINFKSCLPEKLQSLEMKISVMQETLITQKFGNPDKFYKKICDLGCGSYGTVYKAKNLIFDNIVAIKVIEKIQDNMIDDIEIKNEINILKTLSHPNIVKIYEFYDTPLYYYLVTEYCKNGELFAFINNKYNEKQLAVLFYQVFSGLVYLHEKKILHGDLKLENLMISEIEKDVITNEEYFWIKIIDFGTAKIFEKNRKEKAIIGSSYYIAPEVLKQSYNEKCDTWSVGVILYMTLVGSAPFDGRTDEDIIRKIKIGKYNTNDSRFQKHSDEVKDLVNKLLEKDIEKRLSAKAALNHPWFEKFGGRRLFNNFKQEDIRPYIENLFNYKYNSKLQELVIAFLVHNLANNDETLIILKLFRYINKAGDCKLTKNELTNALYYYKDKDEVDEMADVIFDRLDGDNNGYIEYEEFLRACLDKKSLMTRENLKYAFKFLDTDHSKTLNAQKIIKVFLKIPNQELEAVFNIVLNEVDKDSDGIINFDEFMELMLKI